MARKKISQLESAVDVTANDLIQIVDVEDSDMAPSGTNKKATAQLFANELGKLTNVTATGSTTARSLANRFADVVNVKDFGAKGDGVTDDTAAIQAAINSLIRSNPLEQGGNVYFPKGTYRTSSPILLYSFIHLIGDSRDTTYIMPINGASFTSSQGIVMTANFAENANLWNYYPPYPLGLHMGVGMRDITIDGNRSNVANANGLMIYGGQWDLKAIAVINTQGHGIWTECGVPVSSTVGNDREDFINMHESTADDVFISQSNKHGWFYRGPNDSYINNIQVKIAGWAGFYQDQNTSTRVSGLLKIGSLHCYACQCNHESQYMIELRGGAMADMIYVDSSLKGGLLIESALSRVNMVEGLKNNLACNGEFYTIKINTPACSILSVSDDRKKDLNLGSADGGSIHITEEASGSYIGYARIYDPCTFPSVASVGVKLEGSKNEIESGRIYGVGPNFTGLRHSASESEVDLILDSCSLGLNYLNSGKARNILQLQYISCTQNYQYQTTPLFSDIITFQTSGPSGLFGKSLINYQKQDVTGSGAVTINVEQGSYIRVNLNANTTINNPIGSYRAGDVIKFDLFQDVTGGRDITWGSDFKTSYSNSGNTSGTRAFISFIYSGSLWIQESFTAWY